MRFRSRGGNWVAIEASGSALRDAEGNVAYLLGTARDVSEREELRDRVREVDALYRIADAIARTTRLNDLLDEAVDALLDATDADRASVLLYDEELTMRYVAWRGLSDEYRAATEGHSPWAADTVDPEPVLVPDAAASGFEPEPRARCPARGHRRARLHPARPRRPPARQVHALPGRAAHVARPGGAALRHDREPPRVRDRAHAGEIGAPRLPRAARDDHEHRRRGDHRAVRRRPDRLCERERSPRDRLRHRRGLSRSRPGRGARPVRDARRGGVPARPRRASRPPRAPR